MIGGSRCGDELSSGYTGVDVCQDAGITRAVCCERQGAQILFALAMIEEEMLAPKGKASLETSL